MNTFTTSSTDPTEPTAENRYPASRYLRWGGIAALVLATADFLLQGIRIASPGYRDWIIIVFAVALACFGLLCGYVWKETRGARAFFGLATALLPIQAAQIGAKIFDLSQAATVGGTAGVILDLVITGLVFLPIASTGYRMLARPHAGRLLGIAVLGSTAILLPWRDPVPVTLLLTLLWGSLYAVLRPWFHADVRRETTEARIAMGLGWIAPVIIAGRSLYYPEATLPLSMMMVLFGIALSRCKHRIWRLPLEMVGVAMAIAGWLNVAEALTRQAHLAPNLQLLVSGLPIAILLMRTGLPILPEAGAILACGSALISLWNQPGHDYALLGLLVGMGVASHGFLQGSKARFAIGLAGSALSLGYYLRYAVDLYRASSWLSLALLGVIALLAASYIERSEKPLLDMLRRYCRPTQGWR